MLWLINTDLDAVNGYGYGTKMSPRKYSVRLAESQQHVIDAANLSGALDDGIEDRLYVRGRAADDAEHLGRSRLMLHCSRSSALRSPEFFEQADVFDGDNGLCCEGLKQLNLFVCERANVGSADHDRPNWARDLAESGTARAVRIPNPSTNTS